MENKEVEFKNNHKKALRFEEEVLDMLKENNSIRESVIYLGEEVFLENEGEIMHFVKLKEHFGDALLSIEEMEAQLEFENTYGMDRF